jgi:oxygen-independent coproporphyrinogen-3 oxidase
LLRELDLPNELTDFDTLYFGGGTPSLLASDDVEAVRDRARLTADCRVFLEANPEDVTRASASQWRELGVSTLSLGVQSFDDDELSFLGRRHSANDAHRAIDLARDAGFDTLSIDLIFGIPGQTIADWRGTLDAALTHELDHLSCYQLTVHDDTLFGRKKREGTLSEAPNERQADLFLETHRYLRDVGYVGYEVSNFARSAEHRSQHNEKYWNHTPYLGVGPSAHSFDGRTRSWNERTLFAWQRRLASGARPVGGQESLDDAALLLETILLRLRTLDGLDFDDIVERFDVELLEPNRALVERWCEQKLVVLSGRELRPTLEGLAVADGLAASFQLPTS